MNLDRPDWTLSPAIVAMALITEHVDGVVTLRKPQRPGIVANDSESDVMKYVRAVMYRHRSASDPAPA